MSKFEKPCFLLIDQKKNICLIPHDSEVMHRIVREGYPVLRNGTLKELDQTIHEYVKTNFRKELHEEDMTDGH